MKYENEDDRKRFAVVMTWLGDKFPRTVKGESVPVRLSKPELKDFFDALADLPIAKIEWAAKEYYRVGRFFPKPPDLREHARTAPELTVARKKQLEHITPPEEAKKRLRDIFSQLDSQYGTTFTEKV